MEIFEISDHWNAIEVPLEDPQFNFNEYGNLVWSNEGNYKRRVHKKPSLEPSPKDEYLPFFPPYRTRLGRKIFKGDTWIRELAVRPVANRKASAYKIERIRFQAKVDCPGQDPLNWTFYYDYHPIQPILSFMQTIGSPEDFISSNWQRWQNLLSETEKKELPKIMEDIRYILSKKQYEPNLEIYDLLLKEKTLSSLSNVLQITPLPFQISRALYTDREQAFNFWSIVKKYIDEDNSMDPKIKNEWNREITTSNRLWAMLHLANVHKTGKRALKIPSNEKLEHYRLNFIAQKAFFTSAIPSFQDHSDLLDFLFVYQDDLKIDGYRDAWYIMLSEFGDHETNTESWRVSAANKFGKTQKMKKQKARKLLDEV